MRTPSQSAEAIIDEVLQLLDENSSVARIDHSIDAAYSTFIMNENSPCTNIRFQKDVARFIRHIYKHGHIPLAFPETQSFGEAIALLEQMYQGTFADGYEGAYLDALNTAQGGLSLVLRRMLDLIKASERRKHTQWVFTTRILSRSWEEKCDIAKYLQERWHKLLPHSITSKPSIHLAHELPLLISCVRDTISQVTQISKNISEMYEL